MVRPRPLGSLGLGQVAESARQAQESPSLIFLLDTYWVPPPPIFSLKPRALHLPL